MVIALNVGRNGESFAKYTSIYMKESNRFARTPIYSANKPSSFARLREIIAKGLVHFTKDPRNHAFFHMILPIP